MCCMSDAMSNSEHCDLLLLSLFPACARSWLWDGCSYWASYLYWGKVSRFRERMAERVPWLFLPSLHSSLWLNPACLCLCLRTSAEANCLHGTCSQCRRSQLWLVKFVLLRATRSLIRWSHPYLLTLLWQAMLVYDGLRLQGPSRRIGVLL